MQTQQLIGLAMVGAAAWLAKRPRRARRGHPLDRALFTWANTPYRLRQIYQSVLILGAAGSGKTSGSGRHFFRTLLSIPNSGGLIIASKPEERGDVTQAFRAAGRLGDLTVFGPDEPTRINFLDTLGGDANNLTNGLEILSEMMSGKKGESKDNPFWDKQRAMAFYKSIVTLQLAKERVSGNNIEGYILGAATSQAMLESPDWKSSYAGRVLRAAYDATKTPREAFDFGPAYDYWARSWPSMHHETRANVIAECLGTTFYMNTGVVRDLTGTTTNFDIASLERGKWLLVDMPLQVHGESGRITGAALKYLLQRRILARHATGDDGPCCLWVDEAQNYANSYDAAVLAEQRSHRGVTVYLTQSLHPLYAKLGEHFTDGLLTNFGTKVFHQLGDAKTAHYASSLLGDQLDITASGSPGEPNGAFDSPAFRPSFSEHWLPVIQPAAFLTGLQIRDGVVPAIAVTSDPFASGQRYAHVSFNQR